jgi:hypothetical protein
VIRIVRSLQRRRCLRRSCRITHVPNTSSGCFSMPLRSTSKRRSQAVVLCRKSPNPLTHPSAKKRHRRSSTTQLLRLEG